tara:strand:- start:9 stop:206 length:198 start_codon:yes stop_codon:yes gene_type:complete
MFNIKDKSSPSLSLLAVIYTIFLGLWMFLLVIKVKYCKKNENISNDQLNLLLIPSRRELELYQRL